MSVVNRRGYGWRLLFFWFPDGWTVLWIVMGLLPILFVQTAIHEGWHAAFAGYDVEAFLPYQHCNAAGNHFNGRVVYQPTAQPGIPAAPQIMACVMIAVFSLIIAFWPFSNRILRYFMRLWYLALFIDFGYITFTKLFARPTDNDWGQWQAELGWSDGGMAGLTWLFWIIFIFGHMAWIYWARWHDNRPSERASFFSYKWAAIPLAVISTIAIICMFACDHNTVERCGLYYAELAGQFVMLACYIGYFIWSMVRSSRSN